MGLNPTILRQAQDLASFSALQITQPSPATPNILFKALAADGAIVFGKACELGLEGIVSKRQGSFYRNGRSRNWLKAKYPDFLRT
jgi:ATP-dependent DNA ligase